MGLSWPTGSDKWVVTGEILGAKVTVMIVEEPNWLVVPSFADLGAFEELGK